MGTGYNRTDTTNNIATGNIINASDLDAEYDAIDAAFDETTGHDHGGASGNGAPITKVGPAQDVVVSTTSVTPKTTNTLDLGTPLLKFKDLNLAGNALISGNLGITGNTTFTGAIISDSTTDSTSTITGAIQTDGGLGVAKALWVGGLANIAGAITIGGIVTGSNVTDSTSSTTGAIKTAGGLGVAKALWVGGLANIAGVATFTSQPILSSLTASRAVFTDASKGLVSNALTGTGNVVMSDSPTLTGTIGAASQTLSGSLSVGTTLGVTGIATFTAAPLVSTLTSGRVIYAGTSGVLQDDADLTFNGTTLTSGGFSTGGNFAFTGSSNRITGNFADATDANRVIVQNSSTNSNTVFATAPNGTGTIAGFNVYGAGSAANCATGAFYISSTSVQVSSFSIGSGTALPLTFATASAERMRIDTSGNVGIGINNPNYPLNIVGRASDAVSIVIRNRTGNDYANLSFSTNDGTTIQTGFVNEKTGTNGANLLFNKKPDGSAATEAMRLTSGGELLIGQQTSIFLSSGRGVLEVNGSSGSLLALNVAGSSGSYLFQDGSNLTLNNTKAGYYAMSTNNVERMRLNSSGDVLINTTDNTLYNNTSGYGACYRKDASFDVVATNDNCIILNRTGTDGGILEFRKSGTIVGSIGVTSSYTALTASGTLYLGGSGGANFAFTGSAMTLSTGGGNLSITNTSAGDQRPLFISNSSATGTPNGSLYINNTNNTNDASYSFIQCNSGGSRFIVYGNGAVNATGPYTNVSDIRVKKDIIDATPKLEKLMQVRVVNYVRTDHTDNIKEIGVISQELEQIFPSLIMEVEEKDVDGNVTCPDRKLVKYSAFTPILIKAIQEQQVMMEELKAKVAALEAA